MRLALIADRFPPDPGGLALAVARVGGGLAAAGHAVDVFAVSSEETPGEVRWEGGGLRASGEAGARAPTPPRVCRVGARKREDDTAAQLFDELVSAHRREPYDVVHGFYLVRAGFLAAYAGRYLGVPSVASARGNDLDRALFDPAARAGILRALELADVVTAVSHDLARKARALAPSARVEVVANGVDAGRFRPLPRDARLVSSLALDGRQVIGFCGELRRKKGLVPLLDALARLGASRPVALLAVGGVRRDDEAHVTLFRRRHPRVPVATLDWRDARELPALYALMDVFAHPSLRDGLPNALLEAMACARPVVASTAGGIPDALRDGVEGRLVAPADPDALAAGIAALLDDRERAASLGRAARARVEADFSPAREVERTLAAYALAAPGPDHS